MQDNENNVFGEYSSAAVQGYPLLALLHVIKAPFIFSAP